jgi:hypothetical protein
MRPLAKALHLALVFAFLAGCGTGNLPTGNASQAAALTPISVIPAWMHPAGLQRIPSRPFVYRDAAKRKVGIYAAQFWGTAVNGYDNHNENNAAPICQIYGQYVNGFHIDAAGDLVIPSGSPQEVSVYRRQGLCGKRIGTFSDSYGQASDAAATDAETGTIVVGNIEASQNEQVGNIAICTLKKGCTKMLKGPTIKYWGGGVAAAGGDCWMASEDDAQLSKATLTYFKGCTGSGKAAKNWKNAYYGGLIVDKAGNLISVDFETPALWVYNGCNPICRRVAGPFKLEGESFYGNLSVDGGQLTLGDYQYGQVDVYKYLPKKLTYEYSFNNGLTPSDDVEAAGFTPTL